MTHPKNGNSDQSSGFRIPKWTDRIRRPVGPPTTGFLESLPAARRCPARPDLRGTWGTGRDSEPQWNTFNLVFFKQIRLIPILNI